MPAHQLPVAITLLVLAVCSFLEFNFSPSQYGKIKLHGDDEVSSPDPFDVTTPEDIVDGEPLDGQEFWRRVSPHLSPTM
jgi:hypothetical protein